MTSVSPSPSKGAARDAYCFSPVQSRRGTEQKHKDVVKALKAGQSIRNAAKITGKGEITVQRGGGCVEGLKRENGGGRKEGNILQSEDCSRDLMLDKKSESSPAGTL
jgi:hypothetical protein